MTATSYVHGGTDPREVARLEKQAEFSAFFTMKGFEAPAGAKILDVATGVGATAGALMRRLPGVQVFGVDLSPNQIREAKRNHPQAHYTRANAGCLPFREASFDRVFCSWLLEHVPDPLPILQDVRRVLVPGGYCQLTEVDNSTFAVTPPDADIEWVMNALNEAQIRGGGDPFVGKRVRRFFEQAGFSKIDAQLPKMVGDAGDPAFYKAFAVEFAEIFEGLDEALGAANTARIQLAATKLRARVDQPGTSMHYSPVVVRAYR
ncbi:MAG: class I SAM-dependent methyltransferase [Myxococcaceae bacterium]